MRIKMNNIVNVDFKAKRIEKGAALLKEAQEVLAVSKYTQEEIALFYEEQIDPLFYNMQHVVDVDFIWIPTPFDKDYTV